MAAEYAIIVGQRHWAVFAIHQQLADQYRGEALADGVETPVFGYAHRGVYFALYGVIPPPGAGRGYFQHEIGGFALPPYEPGMAALVAVGPDDDVDIGGDAGGGVVPAVVHEHIASGVNVGSLAEVDAQGGYGVGKRHELPIVFGHRFAVR